MDAARTTRQLEETIDEFERHKIQDIKVCCGTCCPRGCCCYCWRLTFVHFEAHFPAEISPLCLGAENLWRLCDGGDAVPRQGPGGVHAGLPEHPERGRGGGPGGEPPAIYGTSACRYSSPPLLIVHTLRPIPASPPAVPSFQCSTCFLFVCVCVSLSEVCRVIFVGGQKTKQTSRRPPCRLPPPRCRFIRALLF